MRFRTEITIPRPSFGITHDDRLTMLGSCFTDEVGARLAADGFDVMANPLGPVYNPVTLAMLLDRAIDFRPYDPTELTDGHRGSHCLDFASRYSGASGDEVASMVNADLRSLSEHIVSSKVVILTLGSAYVFTHIATGRIVGNCHKFPASDFTRRRLSVDEITDCLAPQLRRLSAMGSKVILTVSPIRHLADGLHGNTLGKAVLHLAADALVDQIAGVEYFPAFEILVDDLRDYRFYAEDMKHPSSVAVDYIYDCFSGAYFSAATRLLAEKYRCEYKRTQHRQIL